MPATTSSLKGGEKERERDRQKLIRARAKKGGREVVILYWSIAASEGRENEKRWELEIARLRVGTYQRDQSAMISNKRRELVCGAVSHIPIRTCVRVHEYSTV